LASRRRLIFGRRKTFPPDPERIEREKHASGWSDLMYLLIAVAALSAVFLAVDLLTAPKYPSHGKSPEGV